ncbi:MULTISPECIES: hypothetical protein [Paenibacillus]|uniref:Uncharacterized protein n=1 Tax=Paenibacillus sabinae T27 TaxID=1268072 RepID=X4ZXG8_9BACL|nr:MULTISPECIES: hypothetical protein [Paenibacillus]AHV96898.1 hypothetical protein PSAB_09830 [Paenibacillus sabinae T27]NJJ40383.1 hypothetical protein [Paenibacillus apii]
MSAKRKPPTMHQKKEEVNRKAILWVGVSIALLVLVFIILFIVTGS